MSLFFERENETKRGSREKEKEERGQEKKKEANICFIIM